MNFVLICADLIPLKYHFAFCASVLPRYDKKSKEDHNLSECYPYTIIKSARSLMIVSRLNCELRLSLFINFNSLDNISNIWTCCEDYDKIKRIAAQLGGGNFLSLCKQDSNFLQVHNFIKKSNIFWTIIMDIMIYILSRQSSFSSPFHLDILSTCRYCIIRCFRCCEVELKFTVHYSLFGPKLVQIRCAVTFDHK